MSVAVWEILAGVNLDLLLGDPRWLPHPIRGLGRVIMGLEPVCRRLPPARIAGVFFVLVIVSFAAGVVWLLPTWLNVYWVWSLLAIRELDREAARVVAELQRHDPAAARSALSRIVGRDTHRLDEPEIVRATVETVAENLNDGVVAPLFYLALFGPVGMACYKAVNTLDSMVGYRNDRYREFGWASARLDDAANYLPARLTAVFVWVCALPLRLNARGSVQITLRDAATQPSPNAGYPEAAFAGALGVQLGGVNYYQDKPSEKHRLGNPDRPLEPGIYSAVRGLLYAVSGAMVILVCMLRILIERSLV